MTVLYALLVLLITMLATTILGTSNRIPTRGSSQKGSHIYFLLIVAMVLLL